MAFFTVTFGNKGYINKHWAYPYSELKSSQIVCKPVQCSVGQAVESCSDGD